MVKIVHKKVLNPSVTLLEVEAPLPEYFVQLLVRLGKNRQ